jgi:hypothetical protein
MQITSSTGREGGQVDSTYRGIQLAGEEGRGVELRVGQGSPAAERSPCQRRNELRVGRWPGRRRPSLACCGQRRQWRRTRVTAASSNGRRSPFAVARENCKIPPHLGLGFQKTTTFEKHFKKPPVCPLTVARNTDCPLKCV